jgi:hypothetical protein
MFQAQLEFDYKKNQPIEELPGVDISIFAKTSR